MNRISQLFRRLRSEGKKAFIPYIMAGDPTTEKTVETLQLLERSGADMIELGVPFTDPLADGPTIQRAAERALKGGMTLRKVIELVRSGRPLIKIPIVLMTYYNPVFKYGEEKFVKDSADAGVDGLIIPDLPPDEAGHLSALMKKAGMATIFMLAPTSPEGRMRKVASASTGFIYYVSVTGITGSRIIVDDSLRSCLQAIRAVTEKPVAVGFGVSSPEEAHEVAQYADGVIVGSALVKRLHESPDTLGEFVSALRKAIGVNCGG